MDYPRRPKIVNEDKDGEIEPRTFQIEWRREGTIWNAMPQVVYGQDYIRDILPIPLICFNKASSKETIRMVAIQTCQDAEARINAQELEQADSYVEPVVLPLEDEDDEDDLVEGGDV